ncbi:MAG: hypothetical protein Q9181_006256 [Wetmoreana brouardii]
MADPVRPDPTAVQQMLQRSRALWSSYAAETPDPRLPAECIQLRNILGRVPAFPTRTLEASGNPSTLRYTHTSYGLLIKGASTWRTSLGDCDLPAKTLFRDLLCGGLHPTACTFQDTPRCTEWPGVNGLDGHPAKGNHLAILFLAWAYILSARWLELQPSDHVKESIQPCGVQYSDLQAPWKSKDGDVQSDAIEVDLGVTCGHAVRWWAAILAPGERWHVQFEAEGKVYWSPWSARLATPQTLRL